jgi:hypothetical protein
VLRRVESSSDEEDKDGGAASAAAAAEQRKAAKRPRYFSFPNLTRCFFSSAIHSRAHHNRTATSKSPTLSRPAARLHDRRDEGLPTRPKSIGLAAQLGIRPKGKDAGAGAAASAGVGGAASAAPSGAAGKAPLVAKKSTTPVAQAAASADADDSDEPAPSAGLGLGIDYSSSSDE